MSVFDGLFSTGNGQDDGGADRFFDSALKTYYRARLANDIGDRLMPSPQARLDEADRRLSIRLKKKQLGLPLSSDDYELDDNSDVALRNYGRTATMSRHALDAIPQPGFLKAPPARALIGASIPQLENAGSLETLLGAAARAGGSIGGRIGSVAKFVR